MKNIYRANGMENYEFNTSLLSVHLIIKPETCLLQMPDRLEKAKREKQEKERKMRGRKKEKSVY
jgi:hypothetical protein